MSQHDGPPSDPYGHQQPAYGTPPAASGKGFLGALFDLRFEHFITPMIVKVVYVLAMIGLAISWLFFLATGFAQDAVFGLLVLVLGPLVMLLYLAFIRMTLEFYLAIVRMSQDIHQRLR